MMTMKAQEYSTPGSYTFNVPLACSGTVFVTGVGAGGGGGRGKNNFPEGPFGGGGGAGSAESVQNLAYKVTPGGTLAVIVGLGGISHGNATAATLPNHATPGSTIIGAAAEFSANGGGGNGDGGGLTQVGSIRLMPGAGAVSSVLANHSGMGGGLEGLNQVTWSDSGGAGTQSDPAVPNLKNGHARFFSGAGGGSGSGTTAGNPPQDGGASGKSGPYPIVVGGTGATVVETIGGVPTNVVYNGSGGGAPSIMAAGGTAGSSKNSGGAGAYGSGGGGSGGNNTGGKGGDAYILLTWYEVS